MAYNDFEQYNWQGGDIKFFTSEVPSSGSERLRIKNDGKVGIGTNSPSEKLEVAGNIKANNLVYNTGDQAISGNKDFYGDQILFSGLNVIFADNTGISYGKWQFSNRPTVNGTGVLLSGEASAGTIANVVYTTGDQTVSGIKTFVDNTAFLSGINIGGNEQTISPVIKMYDAPNATYGELTWEDNILTFRNYPDGGGNAGGNAQLTFNFQPIESDGIRTIALDERVVHNFGNETISGVKTFTSRPTVNGTGVLLSGEAASLPTTIVYTTGNQTISGNKDFYGDEIVFSGLNIIFADNTGISYGQWQFSNRPTVNGTGVLLSGEAASLPTTIVYTTGNQTISGIKTFVNQITATSGANIYFSGSNIGVLISGLWNNTGQTYTGVRYNVTLDSGASGLVPNITNSLLNLAVNNTGVFKVNSKGQVLIQQLAGATAYDNTFEIKKGSTSLLAIRDDGSTSIGLPGNQACSFGGTIQSAIKNGGIVTANGGFLGFSKTTDPGNYLNEHTVRLYRGEDFVLDLRNATYPTSGHQFRVFNATGTNSGEFGVFGWQATGTGNAPNALVIGAQATQSGILRDVILTGANIYLNPSGNVIINSVNPTGSSLPALSINNLWNDSTKLFTGVLIDITNNGSSNNSNYLNIKENGTNVFTVRRSTASSFTDLLSPQYGFRFGTNAGTIGFTLRPQVNLAGFSTNTSLAWGSDVANLSYDLVVLRDAANIFAQRNGLNAQQFRVYNYTGTNSGEFGVFGWQATGTGNAPNALVIGAQASQSGTVRDVVLNAKNTIIPTGNLYIGTPNSGTSRIYLANPGSANYYQITPNTNNMSIGYSAGTTISIDSNFVYLNNNLSINGAGYLLSEGTNGFISLRDTYSTNNTVGTNNQGFNIYKVYSGLGVNREFLTLGWTGFTAIIGTRIGTSGTLRDLIITGANITIASSGVIIPNPTVPTSTGSAGTRGQISWDNDFIYVCVSGNSWKRSALTIW